METQERKEVWKDSLRKMKTSLASSYDMATSAEEERKFLNAWENGSLEFVVFSDYRRNEGRRRLRDVVEVIDRALEEFDDRDALGASSLYLDTLKTVALFSKWAKVLETSVSWRRS
ncbi:MAG: hypothetical protein EAX95_15035 [Candidatus Thorarchaeota archaeon]|nr:hypothetical protein [Candidatus Thorarchaeota archaeon]